MNEEVKKINQWMTFKSGGFEKDFELYSQIAIALFTTNRRIPQSLFSVSGCLLK